MHAAILQWPLSFHQSAACDLPPDRSQAGTQLNLSSGNETHLHHAGTWAGQVLHRGADQHIRSMFDIRPGGAGAEERKQYG